MDIILTVIMGAEHLRATGKARKVFDLTRKTHGYFSGRKFVPFRDLETFELVSGENGAQWIELVGGIERIKITVDSQRLYGEPCTDGSRCILEWTRESSAERFTVPVVMDDDWSQEPQLEFRSHNQYQCFIGKNTEKAAAVLNELYNSYEKDQETRIYSELALITVGEYAGRLTLISEKGPLLLDLDMGDVVSTKILDETDLAAAILFKLHYGRYRNPVEPMTAKHVIRDLPRVDSSTALNGRQWVPQLNQFVMVEGLDDVYVILRYHQDKDKFSLLLADEEIRQKDMERNKASKPRVFMVTPTRLRPMMLDY